MKLKENKELIVLIAIVILLIALIISVYVFSDFIRYDVVCPYCEKGFTIVERIKK